jgi:hypothetical protein
MPDSTSPSAPPADSPAVKRDLWLTFAATLGCFVIFLVVLYLAYVPQRRAAPEVDLNTIPVEEQWKYTPAGRRARLDELRAHEQAAAAAYAWIDRGKGVVQLPLDRAMALTLQEANASRHR